MTIVSKWSNLLSRISLRSKTPARDTHVADTNIPDTHIPDTYIPDTYIPDTHVADTRVPDMHVADTGTLRLVFFKNQWVKGVCCFVITLAVIWQVSHHVGLVYSRTNSLPYHLFLHLKHVTPKRGDYTCFHCPWYGGRVIKKIVGMEGDTLSYDDKGNLWVETQGVETHGIETHWVEALWIGRQFKIGKQKKKAKDGRPLTPIKPGTIPKGMVFVMGDHERSFDSRYGELGLIPQKVLQGWLLPVT